MEWSEQQSIQTANRIMSSNLHCQIQSGCGDFSHHLHTMESHGQEGRVFPGVPNPRPSKLENPGRPSQFVKKK